MRTFTSVRHAVLLQVRVRRKRHVTHVTLERLVTRVHATVYRQVGVLAERFATRGARERSLTGVNHLVRRHVVLVAKQLVAHVTPVAGVRLLIFVLALYVLN